MSWMWRTLHAAREAARHGLVTCTPRQGGDTSSLRSTICGGGERALGVPTPEQAANAGSAVRRAQDAADAELTVPQRCATS